MLEEQAPWLSLAVSVLLCLAGATLSTSGQTSPGGTRQPRADSRNSLTDRIGTAHDVAAPNPAHAMQLLFIVGTVSLGAGAFLMALTILGLNWSRTPWAAAARSSFDQALAAPVSGTQFSAAAATFAQEERRPYGHIVRDATFEATSEVADCSAQAPGCSPTDPTAPVQRWQGEIHWQERRLTTDPWIARSCSALVIRTRAAGWMIEGSRWCSLLPK